MDINLKLHLTESGGSRRCVFSTDFHFGRDGSKNRTSKTACDEHQCSDSAISPASWSRFRKFDIEIFHFRRLLDSLKSMHWMRSLLYFAEMTHLPMVVGWPRLVLAVYSLSFLSGCYRFHHFRSSSSDSSFQCACRYLSSHRFLAFLPSLHFPLFPLCHHYCLSLFPLHFHLCWLLDFDLLHFHSISKCTPRNFYIWWMSPFRHRDAHFYSDSKLHVFH